MAPLNENENSEINRLLELYKTFSSREQARMALIYRDFRFYTALAAAVIGGTVAYLQSDFHRFICNWDWMTPVVLLVAGIATIFISSIGKKETIATHLGWSETIASMSEIERRLGLRGKEEPTNQIEGAAFQIWSHAGPLVPKRYREKWFQDDEKYLSGHAKFPFPKRAAWIYSGATLIGIVFVAIGIITVVSWTFLCPDSWIMLRHPLLCLR